MKTAFQYYHLDTPIHSKPNQSTFFQFVCLKTGSSFLFLNFAKISYFGNFSYFDHFFPKHYWTPCQWAHLLHLSGNKTRDFLYPEHTVYIRTVSIYLLLSDLILNWFIAFLAEQQYLCPNQPRGNERVTVRYKYCAFGSSVFCFTSVLFRKEHMISFWYPLLNESAKVFLFCMMKFWKHSLSVGILISIELEVNSI